MSYPVSRFIPKDLNDMRGTSFHWLEQTGVGSEDMHYKMLKGGVYEASTFSLSKVRKFKDWVEIPPGQDLIIQVVPKDLANYMWKSNEYNLDKHTYYEQRIDGTFDSGKTVYASIVDILKYLGIGNHVISVKCPGFHQAPVKSTEVTSESILEAAYDLTHGKLQDKTRLAELENQWKKLNPWKPVPLIFNC